MDLRMPGVDGVECFERLHHTWPSLKLVILSACDERETIDEALRAGANAYVLKSAQVWHPAAVGVFSPEAESVLLLGVLLAALWALWQCRRRLPLEYAAYALSALLICTASTFRGQPLLSLDRFVLTIFPLWMAAGA
jgi:hypothetical protein